MAATTRPSGEAQESGVAGRSGPIQRPPMKSRRDFECLGTSSPIGRAGRELPTASMRRLGKGQGFQEGCHLVDFAFRQQPNQFEPIAGGCHSPKELVTLNQVH